MNAAIMHVVATGIFKGQGTFGELVLAISLYTAPLTLINTGLLLIPVLGWSIMWLVGIYMIILQVLALRGVYQFNWLQAIIVATVPYAISQGIGFAIQILFIMMILGAGLFIP